MPLRNFRSTKKLRGISTLSYKCMYLLLTLWSRVLLEKLTGFLCSAHFKQKAHPKPKKSVNLWQLQLATRWSKAALNSLLTVTLNRRFGSLILLSPWRNFRSTN